MPLLVDTATCAVWAAAPCWMVNDRLGGAAESESVVAGDTASVTPTVTGLLVAPETATVIAPA